MCVEYMDSDILVIQFASCGLLVSGLLCIVSARVVFPERISIGEITRKNPVPWSPRNFGGTDGKSPIFGFMWSVIFLSQFGFAVASFIYALRKHEVADAPSLFNQCACIAGALVIASVWAPLFTTNKKWSFVWASVLLCTTSVLATVGAVVAKPFFVAEWYILLGGVSATIFAGWTLVAAGLSIGIVTRVYNHGIGTRDQTDVTGTSSFFPLILSIATATLAIVFANPIFPLPLLVTLVFVPGITSDWRIWTAAIVCILGIGFGSLTVLYTSSDPL